MAVKLNISSTCDFKDTGTAYVEYCLSEILIAVECIFYQDRSEWDPLC